MLDLLMVYITHISSNSSIFEILGVNGSMITCPILVSIEYLQVFLLVLSAKILEYQIFVYSRILVITRE